jgi:hypothetical protein
MCGFERLSREPVLQATACETGPASVAAGCKMGLSGGEIGWVPRAAVLVDAL